MQIEHRTKNDICVIEPVGTLFLDEVRKFKTYLDPYLNDYKIRAVVINLGKVDLIDSTGIGVLVSSFQILKARNATLALCQLNPRINEIAGRTGLGHMLNIYPTESEAITDIS